MNSTSLHVVLALFLIKLALLLRSGILVLLVLRHEIVHVALRLGKFHLVHSLTRVPMQEGLAAKHGCEKLRDTLEHLLDGRRIPGEGHSHLQPFGRNVADACLDVVGNPLYEIARVLVLDIQHLFIDFLRRHTATEKRSSCQITAMTRVSSTHHVLSIRHLLCQLWNCQSTILLRPARSQRCESGHEEVKAWERDQIDSNFPKVTIKLAGKA